MYSGVFRILGAYWRAYGGLGALLGSPYLHLALVLCALTFGIWTQPGWWTVAIGVLPNLLGFTLGGFAIFIGLGDEGFRQVLADIDTKDEEQGQESIYLGLCATFVHFILVQVTALIYAVVAQSWCFVADWASPIWPYLPVLNAVGGGIGFALFLYALTSILAATLHVFRVARMYEAYRQRDRKRRAALGAEGEQ